MNTRDPDIAKTTRKRKLTRKNLVVDAERIRELARLNGTSEFETVRDAVDFAYVAREVGAASRELHARGGIDDVTLAAWVETQQWRRSGS